MNRFLYFDLGNVILNFDYEVSIANLAKLTGIDGDKLRKVVYGGSLQDEYESGSITSDEFVKRFSAASGSTASRDDVLLAASDMFELNTAILPLLSQLRVAGYPMGILSNTCEAHWRLVTKKFAFLNEFFRHAVLSYEVNSMKPNSAIFGAAVETAGVDADHVFFTDDREENYQAAIAAGLDAVHFTDELGLARDLAARQIRFNY